MDGPKDDPLTGLHSISRHMKPSTASCRCITTWWLQQRTSWRNFLFKPSRSQGEPIPHLSFIVFVLCIFCHIQPLVCAPLTSQSISSESPDNFDSDVDYQQTIKLVKFINGREHTSFASMCPNGKDNGKDIVSLKQEYPILLKLLTNASLDAQFAQPVRSALTFARYISRRMELEGYPIGTSETRATLASVTKSESEFVAAGACIANKSIESKDLKTVSSVSSQKCFSDFPPVKTIKQRSDKLSLPDSMWTSALCDPKDKNYPYIIRKQFPIISNTSKSRDYVFFDFDLRTVELDQCRTNLHKCHLETTQCIYKRQTQNAFDMGNYLCQCRKGFYISPESSWFNGSIIESEYENSKSGVDTGLLGDPTPGYTNYQRLNCLPCKMGCADCTSDDPCEVEFYNLKILRGLPLAVQSFCITVCLVVAGIIFRIRRTRVIKTSNWILLEIFLLGSIFLYSTIVVMYFPPSNLYCSILPWLREFGFAVTYGTLLVKVYRVLSGFQSRKAHRVHVRDKDMLKYLGGFILLAAGYMSAWTAANMDHHLGARASPMMEDGQLEGVNGLKFKVCRAKYWDVVVEIIEFLILCLGIYYCHCVRSAPSEYNEMRFITIAMINEMVVSALLHIIRHVWWYSLHPDYVYLIYFIRCHATVTVTLLLIIGPKFWYLHRPPANALGRPRMGPNPDTHLLPPNKLNLASNGDLDIGEINLADMDPEDIRRELKRLYTQVEIYKTKAMRKDNPHVSKRRGGRKQRRFSLQPFYKKHHASASVHEEEVSKLSEESTNSGDEHATSKAV